MKKQWSMIGAIVLIIFVAWLSVLNVDSVPLNFGFAVVEWPLILIIFVSVLVGALIATLFSTVREYRNKRNHKETSSKKYRSEKANNDVTNDETDLYSVDSTDNDSDLTN
ncbi:LapA family protein [Alkalibacterium sp. MB6]|uniref:LapA family protein n=1 Tax=Alkalibacterium sp. MB6 TaxID=2081965 RepID=UPI0013793B09|nr:lipopolysaccharide assembly protein LapA domain-containing protein [Alkalibacterium sp. MB6]